MPRPGLSNFVPRNNLRTKSVINNHCSECSLSYSSDFSIHLETFEGNATSDWLNRIRSYVTFQYGNLGERRQRIFLRMVGEYGPRFSCKPD